ncbi:MAG: DNA polymerase IV [Methanoregula sp.]|nr:DNA polymerase IV [Methanoregula sp.]
MTENPLRIILHLDMDSFYASVEVREDPDLRGKPVVVGADPKQGTGRGVVMTASYEARSVGIRSAMPIARAYHLCPGAIFLPPRMQLYARVSGEIMASLRSFGFPMEQVSIDEAFLDISPAGSFDAAGELGEEIQGAIARDYGLTCSIGIGPSKVVAKIASDYKKPGGLTVVAPHVVSGFLGPLPVRKIPGIGEKAEVELRSLGIRTIGELAGAEVQVLLARFGRGAVGMHNLARGVDGSEVVERTGPRSVSRETTFDADTIEPEVLAATMEELVQDVHRNLTGEGLRFRTVTVKVRYQGFVTRTKARSFPHHTDDLATIRRAADLLLRTLISDKKIRLLGLRLSGFETDDSRQTRLTV